jgi:hypothetical protein
VAAAAAEHVQLAAVGRGDRHIGEPREPRQRRADAANAVVVGVADVRAGMMRRGPIFCVR